MWPAGSPLMVSGTFGYPLSQCWFATDTQSGNEPTFVNGDEVYPASSIYYHSGTDLGGSEGLVDVLAATDGLVVSSGVAVLPGYEGTPVSPRYDVVYIYDARGWYYRYSHMKSIMATPTPTTASTVRINCGSTSPYTDGSGHVWSADIYYSGGLTSSRTNPIGNTTDDTLYQTYRYDFSGYNIPVPNGSYQVTLKFMEPYWTAAGKRVFSVSGEGTNIVSSFDIFGEVGQYNALERSPIIPTGWWPGMIPAAAIFICLIFHKPRTAPDQEKSGDNLDSAEFQGLHPEYWYLVYFERSVKRFQPDFLCEWNPGVNRHRFQHHRRKSRTEGQWRGCGV